MSQSLPTRQFAIRLRHGKSCVIEITEPNLRADSLNLTTWTSAFILASQLHKLDVRTDDDNDAPILELGAGTGLVGMTAALLWDQSAILTDLPGIVHGVRTNVDLNARVLGNAFQNISCGSLDWRQPEELTLENGVQMNALQSKASIILAADTVYDEAHPELISSVILTWLARTPNACAILTYALRVAYLDQVRELWSRLEEGGLYAASDGQERADTKDWDDECLCEWVVWKWKQP